MKEVLSTMTQHEEDLLFVQRWTQELLRNAQNPSLPVKEAIGRCSQICYDKNNMADKLKDIHNIDEYVECLRTDFGWTVDYDRNNRVLICWENNEACLCPIVRCAKEAVPGSMCYCTEEELVRMTQNDLGCSAKATVLRSFVRDNESCMYRIEVTSEKNNPDGTDKE